MHEIRLSKKARKFLDKCPPPQRKRMLATLEQIAIQPASEGKKLLGKFAGVYSARVWPFRILYRIYPKEKMVVIIDIADRKDVYKE